MAMLDKKFDPANVRMPKQFRHKFFCSMHDMARLGGRVERGGRYRNVKWKLA
jgi:hypothetical protein